MKYQTDWRDGFRHLSNLFFVLSYLNFENGHVVTAAGCTLLGEVLLVPSAIKQKSWSTIASSALFLGLALSTLGRGFFG
jgi:hypothetical protein